jgi:hypothetical protein
MTSQVNWGLVIAAGIAVGLLILVAIAGLYLLLTPPPASEPLGTPEGLLAGQGPGGGHAAEAGLAVHVETISAECSQAGPLPQKG